MAAKSSQRLFAIVALVIFCSSYFALTPARGGAVSAVARSDEERSVRGTAPGSKSALGAEAAKSAVAGGALMVGAAAPQIEQTHQQSRPFAAARRLHAEHGVVILQLLNEGYVEMTKSWICNVRRFGTVLPKTLFVTTDQAAYDALAEFDTRLNVVLEPYSAPPNMEYGEMTYWNYMGFRNDLLLKLIRNGISVLLTEADAVWFRDAVAEVLLTEGDLVTMSDKRPPQKMMQGGFRLFRATQSMTRLLENMRREYTALLKRNSDKTNVMDKASDQIIMDDMLQKFEGIVVGWLDPHHFVPGLWYQDITYRKTVPDPTVVLNNWIIGNDAKIQRAKQWQHWFLNSDKTCLTSNGNNGVTGFLWNTFFKTG